MIIENDASDNYSLLIAKNRKGIEQKAIDINFDKDTQRIYKI
ncbi:MAG: hypothetical protein ACQ9MH_14190 [Nitrospinales bacterium]